MQRTGLEIFAVRLGVPTEVGSLTAPSQPSSTFQSKDLRTAEGEALITGESTSAMRVRTTRMNITIDVVCETLRLLGAYEGRKDL